MKYIDCCYNCMYGHDGLNGVFEPPESIFKFSILHLSSDTLTPPPKKKCVSLKMA